MNYIAADSVLFGGTTPVITSTLLNGVLDEIIAGLPVILPVVISFIAIRKGIAFVIGMLRSA